MPLFLQATRLSKLSAFIFAACSCRKGDVSNDMGADRRLMLEVKSLV